MASGEHSSGGGGLLLGANTPVPERYAPHILHAIPRSAGREGLPNNVSEQFYGVDIWHAYELSWLQGGGMPVARVGQFHIPARSPNIVESKSLKMYLNSLNSHEFADEQDALGTISRDVSGVVGADVLLHVYGVEDERLAGTTPPGACIDDVVPVDIASSPAGSALAFNDQLETTNLYSHLLRSLCPVTGQPDWATLCIDYRGPAIDRASLLAYILSYRQHQEFHEQCVERIYSDIWQQSGVEKLTVQALYTRRGGLDICPMRSSLADAAPLPRLNRQ